jgi:hypothetical protein
VQEPTAKPSNTGYVPPNADAQKALSSAIGGTGGDSADAQQKLAAELQALISGGASPLDEQALLQQLQV